jgi:hypothetical protein
MPDFNDQQQCCVFFEHRAELSELHAFIFLCR